MLPLFGMLALAAVAWACTVAVHLNAPPNASPGETGLVITGGLAPPPDATTNAPRVAGTIHVSLVEVGKGYDAPSTVRLAQVPATLDERGYYLFSATVSIPASTPVGVYNIEAQDFTPGTPYLDTKPITIANPLPSATATAAPQSIQNHDTPANVASVTPRGPAKTAPGTRTTVGNAADALRKTASGGPLTAASALPGVSGAQIPANGPVPDATVAQGDLWSGFNRPDRSVSLTPHGSAAGVSGATIAGFALLTLGVLVGLLATAATVAGRRQATIAAASES